MIVLIWPLLNLVFAAKLFYDFYRAPGCYSGSHPVSDGNGCSERPMVITAAKYDASAQKFTISLIADDKTRYTTLADYPNLCPGDSVSVATWRNKIILIVGPIRGGYRSIVRTIDNPEYKMGKAWNLLVVIFGILVFTYLVSASVASAKR